MPRLNDDPYYGLETVVPITDGGSIRCEPASVNAAGTTYVRVCDRDGNEVAYWNVDEWSESPEQAIEVMGAIMGAAISTINQESETNA